MPDETIETPAEETTTVDAPATTETESTSEAVAAPKGKAKAAAKTAPKEEKIKLVKMTNEDGITAEVHPDEVRNYARGGYIKD